MRTDYFDDLLPDFVTSVTTPHQEPVTLKICQRSHENNELDEVLPALPVLPVKTGKTEKKAKQPATRYAYCFRLHNGEGGGTYLTDARTLDAARAELLEVYSSRLAIVVQA